MREPDILQRKARELIAVLNEMPEVKGCTVYGSLAKGAHDSLSDMDIEIDVSGYDNGRFMLELPKRLGRRMRVLYSDYAPSLVPDKYIVSVAIDEQNPFLIADLCCSAAPHCTTISRQQAKEQNDPAAHLLKLWTINLKHYARGADCRGDIVRMGQRMALDNAALLAEKDILEKALCWLESHVEADLKGLMASCRARFEELVK